MRKFIVLLMLCFSVLPVWAAEAMLENAQVDTSLPTIERGVEDLMNNCHTCHSNTFIFAIWPNSVSTGKRSTSGAATKRWTRR